MSTPRRQTAACGSLRRDDVVQRRNVEDARTATSVGHDEIHRQVLAVHGGVDELTDCGRGVAGEQTQVVAM